MSKAIAVGEKQLILGFKAMGFEIIALEDNAKLMQTLIISSDRGWSCGCNREYGRGKPGGNQ